MTSPPGDALRILLVTKGLDIGGIERMVVGLVIRCALGGSTTAG